MSWVAVQTCSCSLIELIQREMDVERDLYGIKDVQAVGDVVLPRLRGCCSIYVKSRLFRRREMDSNHRKLHLSCPGRHGWRSFHSFAGLYRYRSGISS